MTPQFGTRAIKAEFTADGNVIIPSYVPIDSSLANSSYVHYLVFRDWDNAVFIYTCWTRKNGSQYNHSYHLMRLTDEWWNIVLWNKTYLTDTNSGSTCPSLNTDTYTALLSRQIRSLASNRLVSSDNVTWTKMTDYPDYNFPQSSGHEFDFVQYHFYSVILCVLIFYVLFNLIIKRLHR